MEHLPYLFAGFTVVWIVIFLYVVSLDRRSRRAERDLDDLRRRLDERRQSSSAAE